MEQRMPNEEEDCGWAWFDADPPAPPQDDDLANAAAACFSGRHGRTLIHHLRSHFLDRRLSPSASDAELRHVEGQRCAIAYLLRLAHLRG
jgi:hypothetical protein